MPNTCTLGVLAAKIRKAFFFYTIINLVLLPIELPGMHVGPEKMIMVPRFVGPGSWSSAG